MIYSGFWRRFVALIIDGFVLAIPMWGLMFLVGFPAFVNESIASFSPQQIESMDQDDVAELMQETFSELVPTMVLLNLLSLVIPWLYYAFMESSSLQATLGKLAMGSIVTDLDGDPISFLRATGRYFGKYISNLILCIGFLMAAFTERKQALHDMMAGCLVVQKQSAVKPLYDLPE